MEGSVMNKPKIDHPKVFISYAWGTKEYQDKVLAYATALKSDGVDIKLDKWSLKEGNDTYAFYGKERYDSWPWFPMLYIYNNSSDGQSMLSNFSRRLRSKEWLMIAVQIFGQDQSDTLTAKFIEVEKRKSEGTYQAYRYQASFDSAPIMSDFIKAEELGILP
jgi:hypothetical protein